MSESQKRYQILMKQGNSSAWDLEWERAALFYQQALDEISDDSKALTNLGLAWFKLGDYQKSLHHYLLAAKVKPNDPVPLEKAATLYNNLDKENKASRYAVLAAENYLKERNIEKALENWSRAVSYNPENLQAHSRLAIVYERLGRKPQATREYLHAASLLQRSGEEEKSILAVKRALRILPNSKEARKSLNILREGTLLPKPERPKGGTGELEKTKVEPTTQADEPKEEVDSKLNAIDEAKGLALSSLAGLFFEQSNGNEAEDVNADSKLPSTADVSAGTVFTINADRVKIMPYLGKAVELQTIGKIAQAAEALKEAITAGLNAPAAHYSLGWMWVKTQRLESAVRSLQHVIGHPDYALGAYLLLGDIFYQREEYKKAAVKYLEALRTADAMIVPAEFAGELRELYDPLIEHQSRQKDEALNQQLCENLSKLLTRANWRKYLRNTRRELGEQARGGTPIPLAEILIESRNSDILAAMSTVRRLAREGHMGAAIDQILFALEHAPSYLPLHIVLGEVLIAKDSIPEAVQKFKVIGRAYSMRGEMHRAAAMLKRVIELAPMDMDARRQLVDNLVINGKIDESIKEIIQQAEIHYSLAELSEARDAYSKALNLARQSEDPTHWAVRILHRIANIDRQSLEWRKAMENYARICELAPNDVDAFSNSIDLSLKLKENDQALESIDQFVKYANAHQQANEALAFLLKLAEEQVDQAMIFQRMAKQYERMGMISEAIERLDKAGDLLLDAGDKSGARTMIEQILKLDPSKREYQELLDTL